MKDFTIKSLGYLGSKKVIHGSILELVSQNGTIFGGLLMEYPKINTIWKRDMKSGLILEGLYSCDEIEYLASNTWVGTEKVDGTNIRVGWDPCGVGENFYGSFWIRGRTDKASIPVFLLSRLNEIFTKEKLMEVFPRGPVILYGEGYGAKIQGGGGNYKSNGVDFVLFDIRVGEWWLKREDCLGIAEALGTEMVPVVFEGTLSGACEFVKDGYESHWGDFEAEGLVLKPKVDLLCRNRQRVVTKIKCKDYRRLKNENGLLVDRGRDGASAGADDIAVV